MSLAINSSRKGSLKLSGMADLSNSYDLSLGTVALMYSSANPIVTTVSSCIYICSNSSNSPNTFNSTTALLSSNSRKMFCRIPDTEKL